MADSSGNQNGNNINQIMTEPTTTRHSNLTHRSQRNTTTKSSKTEVNAASSSAEIDHKASKKPKSMPQLNQ